MSARSDDKSIREEVRRYYGDFAQRSVADDADRDPLVAREKGTFSPYESSETDGLPEEAVAASAGCGNPIGLASLEPGETVVDFGSGGGINCFMAAGAVGPSGRVIGIDMTPDMIALARRNAEKMKTTNVEFQLSHMEDTPLDDSSVDVVISNCVICLAPDKDAVFAEAFRILRPGGRLYVSDIVMPDGAPSSLPTSPEEWLSNSAGVEEQSSYLGQIRGAGFVDVEVRSEVPYKEEAPGIVSSSITVAAHKP
jgi:SAM-dependent methyltransferase